MHKLANVILFAVGLSAGMSSAHADDWYPLDAFSVDPPFSMNGKLTPLKYVPVEKAEKPWNICVAFPHLKDAYWLGVDYGVIEEAKRQGVKVNVVEAGGYSEISKQVSQVEDCVAAGAQAVILSANSGDGLNNTVNEITKKGVPVIDLINGISSPNISARANVSYYTMGHITGEYLAQKHPAGSEEVEVGWFPGPAGATWVEAANLGFLDAIKGSAVKVSQTKYGDTGKEIQQKLVEDALQANPNMRYVVGTSVTAEATQGLVRERGLEGTVGILAFYISPGVYEGIKRGTILAAPADSMVILGRLSVDLAVRVLEGKPYVKHVGPKIFVVDQANVGSVAESAILAPNGFKPVFNVN